MSAIQRLALIGTFVSSALAHGTVSGIVIGGKYYQGYSPSFQYANPPPTVIGWSIPEDLDNGFVPPSSYSDPDIICHKGATNAGTSAQVTAGDTVELQWTPWPESHHGPVLDYLAKCPGKCETVDKTTLEFFKIDEGGLINDATPPGEWASDKLIANNNSWTVTIPTSIAPGNYVLRHEIIALHSAGDVDGAQNYPQCINLVISSSGSDTPSGTLGTALYKEDDPGILISIYSAISKYIIPGPKLYSGGGGSPAPSSAPTSAPSSSQPAASSSAPAATSSAPAAPSSQAGGASYSAPASTSSAPAPPASSSAGPVSSSAAAPSSSAAPVSSASYPGSSGKCTTTITLSSSSLAGPVSSSAVPSSSPAPASSSFTSAPYYPIPSSSASVAPVGTGTSIPYPLPSSLTSAIAPSGTGVIPVPSGTGGIPVPSSSYAAPPPGYTGGAGVPPTPSPPTGGEIDMAALMAKILKMIKQLFRSAEHGRDFRKF